MTEITPALQIPFFQLMNGEIHLRDFEKWLYSSRELEEALGCSAYLELVSINFNTKYAKEEVLSQADGYLDYAGFEKRKLMLLFHPLIEKNEHFESSLLAAYKLYCRGYKFMDHLGMLYLQFEFGLAPNDEKSNRINEIYPDVKRQAEEVINWLDSGAIKLTGKDYQYTDNRHMWPGQNQAFL